MAARASDGGCFDLLDRHRARLDRLGIERAIANTYDCPSLGCSAGVEYETASRPSGCGSCTSA